MPLHKHVQTLESLPFLTHTHIHWPTDKRRQGYCYNTHSQTCLPRDIDCLQDGHTPGGASQSQASTGRALEGHQYIRFISPSLWKESRYPNPNKNRALGRGAVPWVGLNTRLTSPGVGHGLWGTAHHGPDSLCLRASGQGRGSTSTGGMVPREQRPRPSLWVGRATSASSCSGLQPPDLQ